MYSLLKVLVLLYIYLSIYLAIYLSIDFSLVALIPSVREPLSSRPEVERFREAYFQDRFLGHFGVLLGPLGEAFLRGLLSVFLCFCRKAVH